MTSIPSRSRIIAYSLVASCSVLLVSIALQWLIYDDWLHETGPLRIIGSVLASIVTFVLVLHWFWVARERHLEAQRRFKVIAEMNDRIRNKVQAIACVQYASDEKLASDIRDAVDAIDVALKGMIADASHGLRKTSVSSITVAGRKSAKSAQG